jgi:hypothetical protein
MSYAQQVRQFATSAVQRGALVPVSIILSLIFFGEALLRIT